MHRLAQFSVRQRILMGGVLFGAVIVIVALLLLIAQTSAADDQPIAFNHSIHAANGVQCQFCHAGVQKGPVAGIPSVEKCMGCHQYIGTDNKEIEKLRGYWERQEPIPWKRVNEQPSFVYFNHSSHIAAAVSCGACHGAVERMTVAEPVANLNMGFCLDCHREQENSDALLDCAVCHR